MSEVLFTKHTQKALEWVNQINELLEWENQNYSLDALRAVLHQLRDNLLVIEAVNLGAQLPLVIRGIYFESWRPSQVPLKERNKEIFINSVRAHLEQYIRKSFEDEDIEKIIKTVLQTIASRIDKKEVVKLGSIVPSSLKGFIAEVIETSAIPSGAI